MFLDEIDTVFTGSQPFFVLLNVIIGICQDKGESSLEPNGFSGVHQSTIPVYASKVTAVLFVQSVFHPKRKNIGKKLIPIGLAPIS